ncbi:hypothetical protein JHK87_015771 [Glycine soja]|nr:hypothetical protein JHK87_015771 [Glycine soja]
MEISVVPIPESLTCSSFVGFLGISILRLLVILFMLVYFVVSQRCPTRGKSSHILVFSEDLFFIYLLPPIIFNVGFQVKKKQFFHNFMAIMLFGAVGTLISFCIISLEIGHWFPQDWRFSRVSSRAAQGKNRKTEDTIIGASKKYHLGQLKTKIAKLRTQLLESPKVPCTVSSQAAQDKNSKTKDIIIGASKKYHLRQLKTNIAKLRTQLLEPPKGCYHGDHDEGVKFINIEEEE